MDEKNEKTIWDVLDGTPITVIEAQTNLTYAKVVGVSIEENERFKEKATGVPKKEMFLLVKAKRKDDERKVRFGSVKLRPEDILSFTTAFGEKYLSDWVGKYCSFFIQTYKGKEYTRAKPRPDLPPKGQKEPVTDEPKAEKPVEAHL